MFAMMSLFLSIIVIIWHRSSKMLFNLSDIIVDTETGRVSLYKVGQIIALIVSSWMAIHETRAGRLSEWLFIGYMVAWSGSNLVKRYIDSKSAPLESTQDNLGKK
jgi:hypothetical protein